MEGDSDALCGIAGEVSTPCYVIDTDALSQNLQAVKARARKAGLSLLFEGLPSGKGLSFYTARCGGHLRLRAF